MELALSVGCSNSIRKQSFSLNGTNDEEEGEDPIPLDLKLSWSTDSGPSSSESLRAAAKKHDWNGGCWRFSDEEEGAATTKKKLRLSKEQSSYLEESFKEHHTLNPKEKLALAKQLHLRPRQVEVWFQNRRARTKLKQMDMDCEYLKQCCESLTEENRRLNKELRELKALKALAYHHPPHMRVPATTLTMCPSCEHLVSPTIDAGRNNSGGSPVAKSRFCPP